jgi:amino acid transporter
MTVKSGERTASLRRRLNLPLLVLYGVGVTVGAGIYVLIGATARESGIHAPLAFIVAAFVMAFSAASFSELAGRFPVSAGEAAYVQAGFNSRTLALLTGLAVMAAGIVSSAAISVGAVGYILEFVDLPPKLLTAMVILGVAAVACWGILESVMLAAIFTTVEVLGLLAIIVVGFGTSPEILLRAGDIIPATFDGAVWAGIGASALLAFFAFIGFEDMVNVAEETIDPVRTMPRAIAITLVVSTLLYVSVVFVAVTSVPLDELAAANAPLALVFERIGGFAPGLISAIAIVATLNSVIVQVIMASRVMYGVADRGQLPAIFRRIEPLTGTPVIATLSVTAIILVLALVFDIASLAGMTSRLALIIFTTVNVALVLLKRREGPPEGALDLPVWVPATGAVLSLCLLLAEFL